jgi:hypothetical protein
MPEHTRYGYEKLLTDNKGSVVSPALSAPSPGISISGKLSVNDTATSFETGVIRQQAGVFSGLDLKATGEDLTKIMRISSDEPSLGSQVGQFRTYWDKYGSMFTQSEVIVSGHFTDNSPIGGSGDINILAPSNDQTSLSVWSDVFGPAVQIRNSDGNNASARPLDILSADAGYVFSIDNLGKHRWGSNTGTYVQQDTNLYRSSAGVLITDGDLIVGKKVIFGNILDVAVERSAPQKIGITDGGATTYWTIGSNGIQYVQGAERIGLGGSTWQVDAVNGVNYLGTTSAWDQRFLTSNLIRGGITANGVWGIGPNNTAPTGTLEVYDATATTGVTRSWIREGAGQSTNEVFGVYASNGTTPLLSISSGNVGIGTAGNINSKLTLVGDIGFASASGVATNLFLTRAAAANLQLGGASAASPVAQTLSVQNVVSGTSNTGGATFAINGSQGTGTGAGGSLIFQVAPAGTTGTSVNAPAPALTIDSTKAATFAGAVVAPTLTATTISASIGTLTASTGTAPLVVSSTTPVANLTAAPTTYLGVDSSQLVGAHLVVGRVVLVGGSKTITLTGSAVFTSSNSYVCTVNDETSALAVSISRTSGSEFVISGTGTNAVHYICVGN